MHCGVYEMALFSFQSFSCDTKHTYCLFGCNDTYTHTTWVFASLQAASKYTELVDFLAYKKRMRLKITQTNKSSGQRHGCWCLVYEANILYCVTGGICFSSTDALRNVVFVPSLEEDCRNKHYSLTFPGTMTHMYISPKLAITEFRLGGIGSGYTTVTYNTKLYTLRHWQN